MTFRQFIVNNVMRNKRLYAAYFLSSLFTVMVFFTFAIFAFHPAFMEGSIRGEVLYGMSIAGGIIYVFSFFFVLYSMSSFLQSRKKEFGLLMLQGMSTKQIRIMVFMENMFIGLFAVIGGILLGLVFAKVILLVAENILVIEETLNFYFPILPIAITFVSFIILFLLISLFVAFILRTKKLIDLIKADKRSKGEPKASILLTVFAAGLLGSGYWTALSVKGLEVIIAMLPVIIVVIIGTYLLFTQASVYAIRRLKKNKRVFWNKTNMVLFSDLAFRMKDNARTFFMVAIISTVAFSAIGTLYGLQSYLTGGLKEANLYSFTYTASANDEKSDVQNEIAIIEETLAAHNIDTAAEQVKMHYFTHQSEEVLITNVSDYNLMAEILGEDKLDLKDDEAVVIGENNRVMLAENADNRWKDVPIELADGSKYMPSRLIEPSYVLPELLSYYVVSDSIYEQLPDPVRETIFFAWLADNGQEDALIKAGEAIFNQINSYNFMAIDYSFYQINKWYGPILFIGLFIGIVFFVSAGSFLYFRLYTDLDEDKEKFRAIAKIGLTDKEMKKVINRQTILLFFAPIIVALVHGAIALTALSRFFDYSLVTESAIVLGVFAVIQIIYFMIVRHFYTKQIKSAIY